MVKRMDKMAPIIWQTAYLKVLHWFFAFPGREIGLNDLSAELSISKTTARAIVLGLVREGFLQRETIGKVWRISCNQHHEYMTTGKIPYNLALVYNTAIIKEVNEIVGSPRAIILFGSYRKGDDTEKSDIDIAVEVLDDQNPEIVPLGIIPELGFRKNVPVNMHLFSRNKIDLNLFANIANGIVLEGFFEVRS